MSDSPTPEAGSEPSPAAPAEPVASAVATAVATAEPPAPVAETPAAPPAAPVAVPAAPVAETPAAAPAAAKAKRSVQVPMWLLAGVLGVVLVLGAFFVGRATAPEGDSGPSTLAEAVEMTAGGEMEVGDFDVAALIDALRQNDELDLWTIGDLLLDGFQGNGRR